MQLWNLHQCDCYFRCNDTIQLIKYNNLANKLYKANETEIYEMTGCLSKCDKYEYDVQPMTDIVTTDSPAGSHLDNTIELRFIFTNGRHELKEQVTHET